MTRPTDQRPAAVPFPAKQAGQGPTRWWWTEPAVWTERMLTALQRGVKGGVWYSLIDKVYAPRNLAAAWARVQANAGAAGCDGQSIAAFAAQAEWHLRQLHEQLRTGSYRPQPVRRVWIDKPGSTEQRPLGIPAVRDRVVQTALRQVLEPIYEAGFAEPSYGFRPGRGCLDALRRVEAEAEQALADVRRLVEGRGLTLHPTKTRLVDASQAGGFDFLGYHFERGYRWPRAKSLDKLKDKIRELTPRTHGHALEQIVGRLNATLRGWFHYFKYSHRTTFPRLDKWVRLRVRSILRRRAGGHGCGRGRAHQRWPNAYFGTLGLFDLTTAQGVFCQSH